jgi:enoyl-CoA hydratase/carnithine racemase
MSEGASDIRFDVSGALAIATFDRPHRLNAARAETRRQLLALLDEVARTDAVRVLVLTGEGRAFCAGDDLKELHGASNGQRSLDEARESALLFQEVTRRVVGLHKPIIAALNGLAVGFGAELAVACDLRVAAESASFTFPEAKRGLFVTNGLLYLLPRLVGHGRAMELMLTGRTMDAVEAHAAGLVTHLVPDGQALEAALDVASTIAASAPITVRLLKQHAARARELDLEGAMALEVEALVQCMASEDLAEGTKAFLEKRPPRFMGR